MESKLTVQELENFYIFVGLTGAGKTSAIENLHSETNLVHLPERRELTDKYLIPMIQDMLGEERRKVENREERFRYTREFAKHHPQGIVYALSKLDLESEGITSLDAQNTFVFDGLRSVNELKSAMSLFPNSRYIFLDCPDYIRMERLSRRKDNFDKTGLSLGNGVNRDSLEILLSDIGEGKDYLMGLALSGLIDMEQLAKAYTIVNEEKISYNPEGIRKYLSENRDRSIILDTSKHTQEAVKNQITDWMVYGKN